MAIDRSFIERLATLVGSADTADLARATGINYNTMKNYTSGDRLPKAEQLIEIANNTGFSLNYLLLGVGSPYLINLAETKSSGRPPESAVEREGLSHTVTASSVPTIFGLPNDIEIVIPPITIQVHLNALPYSDEKRDAITRVEFTPAPPMNKDAINNDRISSSTTASDHRGEPNSPSDDTG